MTTTSATSAQLSLQRSQPSKAYQGILLGGLIAGTLDITAAFVDSGLHGRSPVVVLQAVASGFLGESSFRDGLASAALGLGSHFLIAFGAATVYYTGEPEAEVPSRAAYRLWTALWRSHLLVYECRWWFRCRPCLLNFHTHRLAVLIGLAVHMLCIGLPISLAIRGYSNGPSH